MRNRVSDKGIIAETLPDSVTLLNSEKSRDTPLRTATPHPDRQIHIPDTADSVKLRVHNHRLRQTVGRGIHNRIAGIRSNPRVTGFGSNVTGIYHRRNGADDFSRSSITVTRPSASTISIVPSPYATMTKCPAGICRQVPYRPERRHHAPAA